MKKVNRRELFRHGWAAVAASAAGEAGFPSANDRKVTVAAHPWVYAATQPQYDITPILERIFADMSYAGIEAIELMHTALRPADAVSRIAELSGQHHLPVLGMSFSAEMWKREQQAAIVEEAEMLITRLAKLGGRTLGTSVGAAEKPKTPAQLDAQAEVLRKIIAVCEARGVVLNLHNHVYEEPQQDLQPHQPYQQEQHYEEEQITTAPPATDQQQVFEAKTYETDDLEIPTFLRKRPN